MTPLTISVLQITSGFVPLAQSLVQSDCRDNAMPITTIGPPIPLQTAEIQNSPDESEGGVVQKKKAPKKTNTAPHIIRPRARRIRSSFFSGIRRFTAPAFVSASFV